jgi:hypothetical protein
MNLEDLKKEIPFKWRVQSANQYGASCVAYIDSRQVQDLLDEVCGQDGWQCKFEEHKGNLFCHIGIKEYFNDKERSDKTCLEDWVWKSDCGTESNVEKQKGEASDAFKRAAVMWGIGRFLYSKKIVKLPVKERNGKFIPYSEKTGKFVYDADIITQWCNALQ